MTTPTTSKPVCRFTQRSLAYLDVVNPATGLYTTTEVEVETAGPRFDLLQADLKAAVVGRKHTRFTTDSFVEVSLVTSLAVFELYHRRMWAAVLLSALAGLLAGIALA